MLKFNSTVVFIIGIFTLITHPFYLVAQKTVNVRKVNSALSKDHERLGNSSVFIVPPPGFASIKGLNGIMKESVNASIIVLELTGQFESTARLFGAQAMREKNITVKHEEEIQFNGYPGFYVEAEQPSANGKYAKMVLAFGVDSTTLIINASLPAHQMDSTGQALKKAMFTAVYRKFNASPFSNAANYDIDVTGSPFILAKSASNSLVYTTDGKMPTENPEKTALLTTKSEGKLEFRDKKTFATDRIKQLPGIVAIQIDSIAEVTVNGLPAVEIIAYGEDRYTKEKKMIYQLMAFVDFTYYMVLGTTSGQFDQNLLMFQKIAKTLRLK